jgi:CRP-like cAMP-binding protein
LTTSKQEDNGEENGSGAAEAAGKGERLVGRGDVFGEAGLFTDELGLLRRESAKTQSWVSVYVLTAAALRDIAVEYPEVRLCLLILFLACFLPVSPFCVLVIKHMVQLIRREQW